MLILKILCLSCFKMLTKQDNFRERLKMVAYRVSV
jgi:hypothetical protein